MEYRKTCIVLLIAVFAATLIGCSDTALIYDGGVVDNMSAPTEEIDSSIVQLRYFYQNENLVAKLLARRDGRLLKLSVSCGYEEDDFSELEPYNAECCYAFFWDFIDCCMADIDEDGVLDLLVTATFCTGIGKDGSEPYPHALVYLGTTDGFKFDSTYTDAILAHYYGNYYNAEDLKDWLLLNIE